MYLPFLFYTMVQVNAVCSVVDFNSSNTLFQPADKDDLKYFSKHVFS
jgi:hypothetical protein